MRDEKSGEKAAGNGAGEQERISNLLIIAFLSSVAGFFSGAACAVFLGWFSVRALMSDADLQFEDLLFHPTFMIGSAIFIASTITVVRTRKYLARLGVELGGPKT